MFAVFYRDANGNDGNDDRVGIIFMSSCLVLITVVPRDLTVKVAQETVTREVSSIKLTVPRPASHQLVTLVTSLIHTNDTRHHQPGSSSVFKYFLPKQHFLPSHQATLSSLNSKYYYAKILIIAVTITWTGVR